MTVTETVSTNGGYKVFSSNDVRDLPTAIAALINELEAHNISFNQTQFQISWDAATSKPIIIAFCR